MQDWCHAGQSCPRQDLDINMMLMEQVDIIRTATPVYREACTVKKRTTTHVHGTTNQEENIDFALHDNTEFMRRLYLGRKVNLSQLMPSPAQGISIPRACMQEFPLQVAVPQRRNQYDSV